MHCIDFGHLVSLILILCQLIFVFAEVGGKGGCDTNSASFYSMCFSVKGVDVVTRRVGKRNMNSLFLVVLKHVFRIGNGHLDHCVSRLAEMETVGSTHRSQPSTLAQNDYSRRILLRRDGCVVSTVGIHL